MTIRVVVAEDSPTTRALLVSILESDPMLKVVGEAANGAQALVLAEQLRPDVMTVDIHMPELGGLEAIRRIMSQVPTPIVVVSESVGPHDVSATVRALGAGALAALAKPSGPGAPDFFERSRELTLTVRSMSEVKVVRRWKSDRPRPPLPARPTQPSRKLQILTFAASTGGPAALYRIFSDLPFDFPAPILVVQHIANGFLDGLVDWWASNSALPVKVASAGERLQPGKIYVAPDQNHLGLDSKNAIEVSPQAPINGHRPSANFLFDSAARSHGSGVVSVILTGMGQDGLEGLRQVKAKGGYVIAQDEETSVVFGMPGAALHAGLVDALLPPAGIAAHLQSLFQQPNGLEKTS